MESRSESDARLLLMAWTWMSSSCGTPIRFGCIRMGFGSTWTRPMKAEIPTICHTEPRDCALLLHSTLNFQLISAYFDSSLTLSIMRNSLALLPFDCPPLAHFDTSSVNRGRCIVSRPREEKIAIMKTVQKFQFALPETSSP